MDKEQNNKELEKKIIEMNLLENQLSQLDQQFAFIEKHLNDLQTLNTSLEELSKTKKDQEFFSPLGNEIFVRSKILEPSEVLINVGGKVIIKKKTNDAKKFVEEKIIKASELKNQISNEMQLIINEMQAIQQEVIFSHGHIHDETCNHEY